MPLEILPTKTEKTESNVSSANNEDTNSKDYTSEEDCDDDLFMPLFAGKSNARNGQCVDANWEGYSNQIKTKIDLCVIFWSVKLRKYGV